MSDSPSSGTTPTSTTESPSTTSTTSTTTESTSEPPTTTSSSSTETTSSVPDTTSSTSLPPTQTTTTSTTSQPLSESTSQSESSTSAPSPTPSSSIPQITPTTTFQSTVFQTLTSDGSTFTTAPSQITSTFTTTSSDGSPITVTQVGSNPIGTLSSGGQSDTNAFFSNKGAVAAVFVLVGLAVTSIALWIFFAFRRRRKAKRMEHETAIAAAEAASSYRTPLDEDDHPNERPSMRQRTSSALGAATIGSGTRNSAYMDSQEDGSAGEYNPYASYAYPTRHPDGYGLARQSSPPPIILSSTPGHSTTPSGASMEPLMASYHQQQSQSLGSPNDPPAIPPRNPKRLHDRATTLEAPLPAQETNAGSGAVSSFSRQDTTDADARLEPNSAGHNRNDSMDDPRDDYDYSRKLGIRNLPDAASISSKDS